MILGAGAAGLAAASRLIRSGFLDVKIIEASNRTGGRIHSSLEFGRNHGYVELGAQWPVYPITGFLPTWQLTLNLMKKMTKL